MKPISFSSIFFYTGDKKILVQDRSNLPKIGGEYGFFGGKHDEGETPEQALIREIKEELDFELSDFEKIHEFQTTLPHFRAHIYGAPLPENHKEEFTVLEGAGMLLCTLEEFEKLQFSRVHEKITKPAVIEFLRKLK